MRPNVEATMMRSRLTSLVDRFLRDEGYVNVQTPILCADLWDKTEALTVLSREKPVGYLATSPQAYKLELTSSGIPRSFQIAPCFRAEEAHDRKLDGLHYQIDIESANTSAAEFRTFIETLLSTTLEELEFASFRAFNNIPIITFDDAVHLYGTDKPDLRNRVRLVRNLGSSITGTSENSLGIAIPSTKLRDDGTQGLVSHVASEKYTTVAPLPGLYTLSTRNEATPISDADENKTTFRLFLFEPDFGHKFAASHIINCVGDYLSLIDTTIDVPIWITDFPLFSESEEGRFSPYHDLFTSPIEHEGSLRSTTKAKQFDLVCNGIEIASGATRISSFRGLISIVEACGIPESSLKIAYPNLYRLYETGITPSTGCGIGLERLLMIISRCKNIQDVLPFSRK